MNDIANSFFDAFDDAFNRASAGFIEAGQILAKGIAEHGPEFRDLIIARFPKIAPSTWRKLESIGNGILDHRLLTDSSAGASILRRLPGPIQTRALNEGVAVLIAGGETLRVQVDNLTPEQARQVFASDHIRDESAQRAWVESRTPAISAVSDKAIGVSSAWTVKAGKIMVNRPCSLSRIDLANMLHAMG